MHFADNTENRKQNIHSFNHSIECARAREEAENGTVVEKPVENPVENPVEKSIAEDDAEKTDGADAETQRQRLAQKYLGGTLGQGLVLISEAQFDDLCARLSLEELERYMGIVADCERSGKRYKRKTHYRAILDMAEHDRRLKGGNLDDG